MSIMFKRILLGGLVLTSLAWVIYYALDIASEKNNFIPEIVFSKEDGKLLVVVRSDEVNFEALNDFSEAPAINMIKNLRDSSYHRGYFSQKRDHFLLVSEENWNQESIQFTFQDQSIQLNGNEFSIGEYHGKFYKSKLYVFNGEIAHNGSKNTTFYYDKKASASIFDFSDEDEGIINQVDIYFKGNGRVDYISRDVKIEQGAQVKDEQIFSGLVSRNISSYHFYERDYYATIDPDFAQHPMYGWLLSGFAIVEYDGETAIISDYIGGQDPVLVLNDINQTLDSTRFTNKLTKDFPSEGKSYTIKYLEDLVVIAEKTSTCDKILADYKLGYTIANSTSDRYRFFRELPKAVSERYVNETTSYSKAVYQGKLLEAHTGISAPAKQQEISTSINMSCGFDIVDFAVLPGKGNIVALGRDGDIACFSKNQLKWKKKLNEKPLGGIQTIDLHYNNEMHVLINTSSKIHLWNLKGKEVSGFPISLETEIVNEVKFYRWRERSYFLVANENNRVIQYDSKGRELDVFKSKHSVTDKIDVWVSQNRLFAGFPGKTEFTMFEIEKRKSLRSFNILPLSHVVKVPNELFRFALKDGKLTKIDQKGNQEGLDNYPEGKISKIISNRQSHVIVIQTNNVIKLLNGNGIGFGEITVPFTEIEDISVLTTNIGETFIAVIDGLENNLHLFNTNGTQLNTKALEGQTKVHLHTVNNHNCITTVVDQFVIQYIGG